MTQSQDDRCPFCIEASFAVQVLSVTQVHGGHAANVIPDAVELSGTLRALRPAVAAAAQARARELCAHTAAAFGCTADVDFFVRKQPYPPTINSVFAVDLARSAARCVTHCL